MEKTMIRPEKSPIVSREVWLAARLRLLAKERELTRMTDKVNDERRGLPRVRIDTAYVFGGVEGEVSLAELFGSQPKLILQHFMFGPDWIEGCPGCSFGTDATLGMLMHLAHHGYAFAAVSRAPLTKIEAFKRRMGWDFNWVSSLESEFNFNFNVSFHRAELANGPVMYNYQPLKLTIDEMPGLSLFEKDEDGEVYHTYSGYGAESEQLIASLCYDLKERGPDGPVYDLGVWVRHHDKYEGVAKPKSDGGCCCGTEAGAIGAEDPVEKKSLVVTAGTYCKKTAGGVLPGMLLLLMPKCPACLALYLSAATGLGIPFTTARYLRIGLIACCIGALVFFAWRRWKDYAKFTLWKNFYYSSGRMPRTEKR